MTDQPLVIAFDVNQTLSDMASMGARFADVGAPPDLARWWFATLLRDGFALTAAGASQRFDALAEATLKAALAEVDLNRGPDEATEYLLGAFMQLPVHPDVPEGLRRLSQAGFRLMTLSNGATAVAEQLMQRAGLEGMFERFISVEDIGVWKPAKAAYQYAVRRCGVAPSQLMLVAVHPWDIDGAARAGLATTWINRSDTPAGYPAHFTPPDHTVSGLTGLADLLTGGPASS
ncbi:MAG: haloacid dehalogenase type II [Nocardioidaceae bacterium]